jgi:serine/threonine protein kinase
MDIKPLKNGVYGNVFKAIEKKSKKVVVIKEAKQPGILELENEFKWLSNISHPNVASLLSSYTDSTSGKLKGFVLEYYNGGSLQNLIYDRVYKFMQIEFWSNVFEQILSGVAYLHKREICHVDLKVCFLPLTSQV